MFWYSIRLYNAATARKLSDFLHHHGIGYKFDYNYLFSVYADAKTAKKVDAFVAQITA